MRFTAALVGFFALLLTSFDASAEHRYEFDLAKRTPGEVTLPAPPGPVSVVVKNRVPGRLYFYSVTREWVPIPPLSMPDKVRIPVGAAAPTECLAVEAAYQKIGAPAEEADVPVRAGAIDDLIKSGLFAKCADETFKQPIHDAYRTLTSTELIGPVDLRSGEQLRVTVQRVAANGTVEKSWTTILTTGARGEWLTTFGLSFVGDDDERFFMVPAAEQGKFVITAEREPEKKELKYLPTALFSWVPTSQRGNYVVVSPTAGIGATSNTFAALLGLTATFNINLGVTGGVALTHHKRLLGKYTPGQVVAENLTDTQLHRRATIPAAFLGITLRFGQSPFATEPNPPAQTPASATPPAAPAVSAPAAAPTAGAPAGGSPPAPPKGGASPAGDAPPPGAVPPPAAPGGE